MVFPKELNAVMMLYKNTNAMVCTSDADSDFYHIAAEVLHGDTFASYMLIICLDYILRNSFRLKKMRHR